MKYYVARDKNKKLYLYPKTKPIPNHSLYGIWGGDQGILPLDKTLFPELKWTDEPILVELEVVRK